MLGTLILTDEWPLCPLLLAFFVRIQIPPVKFVSHIM
jgi:hypothetical protein